MKPLKSAQDIAHGAIFPVILVSTRPSATSAHFDRAQVWISGASAVDIIIAVLMTVLVCETDCELLDTKDIADYG